MIWRFLHLHIEDGLLDRSLASWEVKISNIARSKTQNFTALWLVRTNNGQSITIRRMAIIWKSYDLFLMNELLNNYNSRFFSDYAQLCGSQSVSSQPCTRKILKSYSDQKSWKVVRMQKSWTQPLENQLTIDIKSKVIWIFNIKINFAAVTTE